MSLGGEKGELQDASGMLKWERIICRGVKYSVMYLRWGCYNVEIYYKGRKWWKKCRGNTKETKCGCLNNAWVLCLWLMLREEEKHYGV